MNEVKITGRIGSVTHNEKVSTFRIAVDVWRKKGDDFEKVRTDWFTVKRYGLSGKGKEVLTKGRLISVKGKLVNETYNKKTSVVIVAEEIRLLKRKQKQHQNA